MWLHSIHLLSSLNSGCNLPRGSSQLVYQLLIVSALFYIRVTLHTQSNQFMEEALWHQLLSIAIEAPDRVWSKPRKHWDLHYVKRKFLLLHFSFSVASQALYLCFCSILTGFSLVITWLLLHAQEGKVPASSPHYDRKLLSKESNNIVKVEERATMPCASTPLVG